MIFPLFWLPIMIFQSCSKIQRKEVKVGDDSNHDLGLVSDLLKEANEDILFEIFVRIPNCRSTILSSSVCHRWRSLISQPQFIPRFISHHHEHQDRYPLPCTIIFRKAEKFEFDGPQHFQPICKLFSEESMFLHGTSSTSYLDFLPSPMVVRASCSDLLLVSPGSRHSSDFYICNPITKQFYQLPEIRWFRGFSVSGHALGRMPECSNKQLNHFKVVLFHHPHHPNPKSEDPDTSQNMTIYCSKLGKWKFKGFHYPRPKRLVYNASVDIVTCNGILYWLEYERNVDRVISLDLSKIQCSVIDFPDDFWWFQSQDFRVRVREQIGAVGGELRLLQVVLRGTKSIVNMKVWKLNSSWVLVHDKKYLKRPNKEQLVATFVHPTNGDVVFMVWGTKVFQYNLMMEDTYEMIDELQEPLKLNTGRALTNDRLMSFPMVHPTWPTLLPSGPALVSSGHRRRHQCLSV